MKIEWISPKEMCPEEEGMILVHLKGKDVPLAVWYYADDEGNFWHPYNYDGQIAWDEELEQDDIIAWAETMYV